MKRIYFRFKICLLMIVALFLNAYAEDTSHRAEDICFYDSSTSFAITEEYVLFVNTWSKEEYAWFPDTVGIDLKNVETDKTIRIAELSSTWAKVFTDGECFYVVESNYLDENYDGPFKISIGKITPEKMEIEWLDTLTFGLSETERIEANAFDVPKRYGDDFINDIQLDNGKLYFISNYEIHNYDLSTYKLSTDYHSSKKITNQITNNRSVVYKNRLYVHKEDDYIYEIDLNSFSERKVGGRTKPLAGHPDTDIFTAPYSYYVFNDVLYYCETGLYGEPQTTTFNLINGMESCILESPITIFMINEKGIWFDIYDGGGSRYFMDFSDKKITPISRRDFDILKIMMDMVK